MSTLSAASLPTPDPKPVVAALGAFTTAVMVLLTAFDVVDWSAAQTAFVTAEAAAVLAFIAALIAHFKPGTKKEPVALAGTFTAVVSSTLALGTAFAWWSLNEDQTGAVLGTATAIVGLVAALFARRQIQAPTTPT